jgi:hypothetical protein
MKIVGAILLALAFASSANSEEYLKSDSVTGRADVHVHVGNRSECVAQIESPDPPLTSFPAKKWLQQ